MQRLFLFILFLSALAGCNNGEEKTSPDQVLKTPTEPVRIVAIGRVEPESKITSIGSEVNGVIQKIYVHAGDSVKKGQLLIEFKHDYEDARLAQIQSRTAAQYAEMKNVQAQIQSAKIKTAGIKTRYERLQRMVQSGAETKQSLDNTQTEYEQADKEVERLTASLQSAESRLNEIKADANVIAVEIERRKVKAPSDGVVLTMDLTEGSAATTELPLFDFASHSSLTVLCEVDELWVNKIHLGQKAIIRIQGTDEQMAEGEVVFLSPYLRKKSLFSDDSSNMEDRRVREVRIRLSGQPALLINSRVEVVIDLTKNN